MKVSWLGHACFYIELEKGLKILTDPYEPGAYSGAIKYLPHSCKADIVTISHAHADHNFTDGLEGATIVDKEGKHTKEEVTIEGVSTYHDNSAGSQRGENIIFIIEAEGLRLVHFGDLGTLDLNYDKLVNIDIALIPVGGVFTIDHIEADTLIERINPKIVIPMHFKTERLGFDIDGVDKFLKNKTFEDNKECLIINKNNLPSVTKIIVLKHLR